MKSCFHLAAIFEFAVSWCEAWNPLLGMGVLRCSEDPIASRLDISGSEDSWLHNSHQFKTNMNIIFFKKPSRDSKLPKSAILRLTSITWSPGPTRRASVLETQDSFVSLVMHSNNRNNVCDASLPRPRLFLWEKPWGREVRVAVATFLWR